MLNAYHHQILLAPDYAHRRKVIIEEMDRYLRFRSRKEYELFYWDTDWVSAGKVVTDVDTKELVFEHVPMNVLLRLVPEYSEGKERPFIVLADGTRYWW